MTRGIGRMKPDFLRRIMKEAREEGVEEIGFYTTGEPFVHTDLAEFTTDAKCLGFR
jgi:molybdenum cofactor biosynthesis enzyme MoaA